MLNDRTEEMTPEELNYYAEGIMFNCQTGTMTQEELAKFVEFFDSEIGADYEIHADPAGGDKVYVVCLELRHHEMAMVCDWEDTNL